MNSLKKKKFVFAVVVLFRDFFFLLKRISLGTSFILRFQKMVPIAFNDAVDALVLRLLPYNVIINVQLFASSALV